MLRVTKWGADKHGSTHAASKHASIQETNISQLINVKPSTMMIILLINLMMFSNHNLNISLPSHV